jgi:membrane protease YdiL (CAAX protease family)
MSRVRRLLLSAWLVALAIATASALASAASPYGADDLLTLCAHALVVELWLAVAAGVGALLRAGAPRRALGLGPGRLSWRRLALLALGTLGASHALDGALDLSGLSEHSVLGELPRVLEGARGPRLLAALLALGLAPGIAEELLCRGLVQRGLARFGPAVAIPAAALLFGVLHVEPIHGAFATILGLYLGVIAWWGGSTRPAMLSHAANYLAAVLLAAAVGDPPWASGLSVVGGSALAAGCLLGAGRRRARPSPPQIAPAEAGPPSTRPGGPL